MLRSFAGSFLVLVLGLACSPPVSRAPLGLGPLAVAEQARAVKLDAAAESNGLARGAASEAGDDEVLIEVEEDEDVPDDDVSTERAAAGDADAAGPPQADGAARFVGAYAGFDVATFRFEGVPERRQEDDKAQIRVEQEDDRSIVIVIINTENGEDLCALPATVSGARATIGRSEPCFGDGSEGAVMVVITGGDAELVGDELRLEAEGTLSVDMAEQTLGGDMSYTFRGTRR